MTGEGLLTIASSGVRWAGAKLMTKGEETAEVAVWLAGGAIIMLVIVSAN